MRSQVSFLLRASNSSSNALFHSDDSFAILILRSIVCIEIWSAYRGFGRHTPAWDLVVIVWTNWELCIKMICGRDGSPASSSVLCWGETVVGWLVWETVKSVKILSTTPIGCNLGDPLCNREDSWSIWSIIDLNFTLSEKSFSRKMTSRNMMILLLVGFKHRYPFMLSGYPMDMCGALRFIFLNWLNGRVLGYARHLETFKSLRFGKQPNNISNVLTPPLIHQRSFVVGERGNNKGIPPEGEGKTCMI